MQPNRAVQDLRRRHLEDRGRRGDFRARSGGYGPVTINKALTINGEGTLASIIMGGSGTATNVAAGASDQVILRNHSINGAGGGNDGIFISSGNVTIDECFIYGFTSAFFGGLAVNITASGSLNVDIRDTALSNNSWGVAAQTTSGTVTVSLDNVHITAAPVFGVVTLSSGVSMSVRAPPSIPTAAPARSPSITAS
jgi:hypothetical protein